MFYQKSPQKGKELQKIPSALPVTLPKVLPPNKKPLPPSQTTLRHDYEDMGPIASVNSKQNHVPNSLKSYPPYKSKSADSTKMSLESTSKPPHNTQVNGNNEIHKKLLKMEEKIGVILSRLSQLEGDVNILKSKQLMDAEPLRLVIHNDTSPAQVQKIQLVYLVNPKLMSIEHAINVQDA